MLSISNIAKYKLIQELIQYSESMFVRLFISSIADNGQIEYSITFSKLKDGMFQLI